MFDSYGQFQANSVSLSHGGRRFDPGTEAVGRAISMFQSLHWRAQLKRVWGKLTRHTHGLLDLDDVRRTMTLESMHEAGCLTIEINKIRGSECRVSDFDDEFLPLEGSTGQRWAGIYAARLAGQSLPAISVIQAGNIYYVRDGHHRVSVARIMGEAFIEANVQVWQIAGEAATPPAMSARLLAAI